MYLTYNNYTHACDTLDRNFEILFHLHHGQLYLLKLHRSPISHYRRLLATRMAGEGQCHRHGYQPERGHEGQMRAVLAGARTQHAAGTIYSHDRRATVFSLLHYQEIPTQSKYSMDIINLPPVPLHV